MVKVITNIVLWFLLFTGALFLINKGILFSESNSINGTKGKIIVQHKLDGGSWTNVPSGAKNLEQD